MDRAYEYDETLALVKDHWFYTVVPAKKNINPPGTAINNSINNIIISNDISWDSNIFEKFLLVMISLTLFLFLLYP